MDILQELPAERWPVLQEKLKSLWPQNLPGFYCLYTNLHYPKLREAIQFKVYCPYGDMDNGFVCTIKKMARYVHETTGTRGIKPQSSGIDYSVIESNLEDFAAALAYHQRALTQHVLLYPITENISKLEEAISKSNKIDWRLKVCFVMVNSLTMIIVDKLRETIGFKKYYHVLKTKMYLLEKSVMPFVDLSFPANTYTGSVKPEHLHRVDDVWSHKNESSHFYFTTLASNGLSYGLYTQSDELVAWIFINEYNFLCHWYCEEVHRRKGYGEFVLKWVVNEQLSKGNDVYGFIVEGNEKPLALFKKTGFKPVDDVAFVYVQK